MKKKILIGCVADDFTGASDAASFLNNKGLKTILFNGIPEGEITDCDSIVIALKCRTQEISGAIADTKKAFLWLEAMGAEHLFFKYCSTFDSTKEGNIGPVTDMLLETFDEKYTILSPALPVNGRSVKNGVLYVDSVPLGETHMKNHPLTPMWDSEIAKLMEPQGKYTTLNINYEMLENSKQDVLAVVKEFGKDKEHFYVVPDYVNDENGTKVAEVFGDLKILTGGSGILAPMADKYIRAEGMSENSLMQTATAGKAVIFSGSCSKATLAQLADAKEKGYPFYKMDPIALLNDTDDMNNIWQFIAEHENQTVVVYSSDYAENVAVIQQQGAENISEILESATANLAKRAVESGYTRIIVAGGETASAVVKKLEFHSFEIGESVAPGVPVMAPLSNTDIRVILKSGNFGQIDFFERAVKMTGE